MSARLARGGRLIDRSRPVAFSFNGKDLTGFAGDTLASALLGAGETLLGRSFKYHRPRGPVASGAEEPNALLTLGTGGRTEPNQRATTTPLRPGLRAVTQNHWPSLAFDIGAVNGLAARLLPAGFYYKTFIHPRAAWKHLFEPAIRQAAGLGRAAERPDPDAYEVFHAFVDVLVAGGGIAGLAAALSAGRAGARVLLLEQAGHWGGRALADGGRIGGAEAADWIAATVAALAALPNVTMRTGTIAASVEDHGYVLAEEAVADPDGEGALRRRLWRIRAGRVVVAAGAIERPVAFAGNDVPGVMLASAMRDFVELWGVAPAERVAVVTTNDDGYRTALALRRAGIEVAAVIDPRPAPQSQIVADAKAAGLRIAFGQAVARANGGRRVTGVELCAQDADGLTSRTVFCDGLAMSGGWSPAVHLWSQPGGKLRWDARLHLFRPDPDRPPTGADGTAFVIPAGAANGLLGTAEGLADAVAAGARAARETGYTPLEEAPPAADDPAEAPPAAVWVMPARAAPKLRAKAFLDFQNDVKVSDVELAAREGYESVEHAKRYTTLGMATDQGKLSNVPGLAVLAGALGATIPEVGTTTFRAPYVPVSLGSLAGEARGPLFKPVRRTVTDGWAEARGAVWEPVGDWRRAFAYPAPGERTHDAILREVRAVREGAGVLDASTLGKIRVAGPDAGRFLDLVYTNVMSSLAPGRCRYGLMCTENGFVFDDGVVVRLEDGGFLLHTTTGGADRVHGHLEEWLQTEWWDLRVWTLNVTEAFAQFAVAGPKARAVLEALGATGIDPQALPHLASREVMLEDGPARVHRISFSGELSFEIAVPAARGASLWERIVAAGAVPYGTEAMHVLRAEKGYIIVGDETDGTVTPFDLGMDWIVSRKKADFIGKRGLERSHLAGGDRKELVGLETLDPAEGLPDGAHAVEGRRADGKPRMIGHVTSTYFSPVLGRHIALGLIREGRRRTGEVLAFPVSASRTIRAKVVAPCFLDPEGARLHG